MDALRELAHLESAREADALIRPPLLTNSADNKWAMVSDERWTDGRQSSCPGAL